MYGLIIKKKWLDLILSGKKTFEIRGTRTSHKHEKIALIESVTGRLRGYAVIDDCIQILGEKPWESIRERACVPWNYITLKAHYRKPCAWMLNNVEKEHKIIHVKRPTGSVIWVNLDNCELIEGKG